MKFMKAVINFDSETLTLQDGSVLDLTVQHNSSVAKLSDSHAIKETLGYKDLGVNPSSTW